MSYSEEKIAEELNYEKDQCIKNVAKKVKHILTNKYDVDKKIVNDMVIKHVADAVKLVIFQFSLKKKPNYDVLMKFPISNHIEKLDPSLYSFIIAYLNVMLYQSFGDTIGYNNGNWEFNYGQKNANAEFANELLYEFIYLGGINNISMDNWLISDDTMMYHSTYVIASKFKNINEYGEKLKEKYITILPDMKKRDAGNTVVRSLEIQKNIEWNKLPYDRTAIGSGASMRSGCLGLLYPGKHNRKRLVAFAIETSRITHNSTIAMLGSIVSALFTAYALERVDIKYWPHKLLRMLKTRPDENLINIYLKKSRPNEYNLYQEDVILFVGQWEKYLSFRFSGTTPRLNIKSLTNIVTRYSYFADNFSKLNPHFAGCCSDDSVIMAYDALLSSDGVVEKIVVYSALHPGDSDTVASIAMSWFGAYYHTNTNINLMKTRFVQLETCGDIVTAVNKRISFILQNFYYDLVLNICKKNIKKEHIKKIQ